jgi:hypothetical protein
MLGESGLGEERESRRSAAALRAASRACGGSERRKLARDGGPVPRYSVARGAFLNAQLGGQNLKDAKRPVALAIHVSGLPY